MVKHCKTTFNLLIKISFKIIFLFKSLWLTVPTQSVVFESFLDFDDLILAWAFSYQIFGLNYNGFPRENSNTDKRNWWTRSLMSFPTQTILWYPHLFLIHVALLAAETKKKIRIRSSLFWYTECVSTYSMKYQLKYKDDYRGMQCQRNSDRSRCSSTCAHVEEMRFRGICKTVTLYKMLGLSCLNGKLDSIWFLDFDNVHYCWKSNGDGPGFALWLRCARQSERCANVTRKLNLLIDVYIQQAMYVMQFMKRYRTVAMYIFSALGLRYRPEIMHK